MRKLIWGLVAVVLIGCAVLSVIWVSRAHAVKKNVEDYIASFTTKNMNITYQEVNVSGFPFSMNISIVNPHITGHINKFIEELGLNRLFKTENLPEWNEDHILHGSINFSVNAFSNKFRMEMLGNITGKADIAGKPIAINRESDKGSVCELQFINNNMAFSNLWNIHLLSGDKGLAQNFRSLDCSFPESRTVNAATNETMLTHGGSRLFISRNPLSDHSDIRFYALVKDMEETKAYDAIYNIYSSAISPGKYRMVPSSFGKQNTEIDVSYSGTESWLSDESKFIPLKVKINKLILSNNAYNINTTAAIDYQLKDNIVNTGFSFKTEMTATELLRSLLQIQFSNFVKSVRESSSGYSMETKNKLVNMSEADTNKMFYSVIPDFNTAGKIVTNIDASYIGNTSLTNYKAELNSLELSGAPYGVTASGSIKEDAASPLPGGNLSISCTNCANMLDDMAKYVEHLQYFMSIFYPGNSVLSNVTSDSVKSFKSFLLELTAATPENAGNLKFDIINDGKVLTVNGKDSTEVVGLYNKYMQPNAAPTNAAPVVPKQAAPKQVAKPTPEKK